MRMKILSCTAVFLMTGAAASFAGEADYTVQDILKFLNSQEATRGICVGTEAECGLGGTKSPVYDLRMTFDKDSDVLTQAAKDNLAVLAEALRNPEVPANRIAVDGYTDASGTDEYNLDLSERRAKSVVSYLEEQGVDTSKLLAQGFGETNPLNGNAEDPANRRVEMRLVQ